MHLRLIVKGRKISKGLLEEALNNFTGHINDMTIKRCGRAVKIKTSDPISYSYLKLAEEKQEEFERYLLGYKSIYSNANNN